MRDLAKLRALGADERRWLALCLIATPAIVLGLRLFGFRRTRSGMTRWPRPPRVPPMWSDQDAAARARLVARVAGIATGRGPVRATCLRRSLLVWWLLRRDGIETALRIGIRRVGDDLRAHAWVEHRGVPLGEADDLEQRYTPFDSDFGLAADGPR